MMAEVVGENLMEDWTKDMFQNLHVDVATSLQTATSDGGLMDTGCCQTLYVEAQATGVCQNLQVEASAAEF